MKRIKAVLSLVVAVAVMMSAFQCAVLADGVTGPVNMIWQEEFNNDQTDYSDIFVSKKKTYTFTPDANGTVKFSTLQSDNLYSKGYYKQTKKYIIEVKIVAVEGSGDLYIGTDGVDTIFDVGNTGAGVYYVVVDKDAKKIQLYNNAGIKDTKSGISSFGDNRLFQLYLSKNRTVTFDYIRVYTINSSIGMTVDNVTNDAVVIKTDAAIDTAGAVFTAKSGAAELTSTSVSVVSMDENKYSVNFDSLESGKTYTLGMSSLSGIDGTVISVMNSVEFAVPEKTYDIYVNNFSEETDINDITYTTGDYTVSWSDGVAKIESETTRWPAVVIGYPAVDAQTKFVVEMKINSVSGSFQMGPKVGETIIDCGGPDIKSPGTYYAIIDHEFYKLYTDDFVRSHEQKRVAAATPASGWAFKQGKNCDIDLDYLAVYEIPATFDFSVVSSDRKNALIRTSEPLGVGSVFSVTSASGTAVDATVSKSGNGHNLYNLTFAQTLDYNTTYTIAAKSISGLNGGIASTKSEEFTTPEYIEPTYSDVVPFFLENDNNSNEYKKYYNMSNNNDINIAKTGGDGYFIITVTGDGPTGVATRTSIKPKSDKYYVEYDVADYALATDYKIYPMGYGGWSDPGVTRNKAGKFYGLLDGSNGTYDFWYVSQNGACAKLTSSSGTGTPSSLDIEVSKAVYGKTRYIAAYDARELAAELGDVSERGIAFKTTAPINTSASVVRLGESNLVIKPVDGEWCSYIATWSGEKINLSTNAININLSLVPLDDSDTLVKQATVTLPSKTVFYKVAEFKGDDGNEYGSVYVYNNTDKEYNFCYLLGSFSKNAELLNGAVYENFTVPANSVARYVTTQSVAYDKDNNSYRSFIWESVDSLIPISYEN